MQNYKKQFLAVAFWTMIFPGLSAAATIDLIDLNDFFFYPGDPVVVSADGSTATISEDPVFALIILRNDGDPEVILAGPGVSLIFDFDFVEGGGNENDEFGAFIIDPSTGGSLGGSFEFFTTDTSSGEIAFDLTSLVGLRDLGLQFQLSALPDDLALDSVVTISNVRLEEVPLPGAFYLFASGLIILWRTHGGSKRRH